MASWNLSVEKETAPTTTTRLICSFESRNENDFVKLLIQVFLFYLNVFQ